MKSILLGLVAGCLFAAAACGLTGCSSSTDTQNKMSGEKTGMEDKMMNDKMTGDKVGSDKMTGNKMGTDKMTGDKMGSDNMSTDKMGTDKMSTDKMGH